MVLLLVTISPLQIGKASGKFQLPMLSEMSFSSTTHVSLLLLMVRAMILMIRLYGNRILIRPLIPSFEKIIASKVEILFTVFGLNGLRVMVKRTKSFSQEI